MDKVVYINLDRRQDRRERMEKLTECFGDKVIRFSAIEHSVGIIGCGMSHLAVLKTAQENGWKNVLVLEDDIEWNKFDEGYATLEKLVQNPYDVIMLGGSYAESDPETCRLKKAACTHAYLINKHYLPIAIDCISESTDLLIKGTPSSEAAIDLFLMKLQPNGLWYIVSPCLLYQYSDYSDILKANTDYIPFFSM